MKKKRDHFIEIFHINYRTIKNNIYPIFVLLLGLVGTNQLNDKLMKIGFVILCVGICIFSILEWYFKIFEFDKQKIIISEGVFTKRYHEIAINRVKSIRTSDTPIKRILGISTFNIEVIGGKRVSFILTNKEIIKIKNVIFSDYELTRNQTSSKNLSFFQCLLLASTKFRLLLTSLAVATTITNMLLMKVGSWIGEIEFEQKQVGLWENIRQLRGISIEDWITLIPFVLGLLLGWMILAIFISTVYITFIYWNFKIEMANQQIQISHGFFDKKYNQIPLLEIRSVRIIQPILFRIFGYVQIKIDVIGSSASKNLYPILKRGEVASFMERHLPMFEVKGIEEKVGISVLPDYLLKAVWLPTVILFALIYIHPYFSYVLPLLLFYLSVGYMRWKYAGLMFDERYFSHSEYKWLQSIYIITLQKYIQHTGVSQSTFTKTRNVASYHYSIYSERSNESYSCYGLNEQHQERFLKWCKKTSTEKE